MDTSFEKIQLEADEYYLYEILDIIELDEHDLMDVRKHDMATAVLLKDIYRIQLAEIFRSLLEKEIATIGDELTLQLNLFGGHISPLLRIIQILKDESIDRESPEYTRLITALRQTLISLKEIVQNWSEFKDLDLVRNATLASKELLGDNIKTLLGENLIVRKSFLDTQTVDNETKEAISKLISQNGFRKVEFSYDITLDKLIYLINSAVRCRSILSNEREDVELFNLLTLLQLNFGKLAETRHIFTELKILFKNRSNVLDRIHTIEALQDTPDFIIEMSPPIYKKVQKNLMLRIYERTANGYRVHIYSLPYNDEEVGTASTIFEESFTQFSTFNADDAKNKVLANLSFVNESSLDEILELHPTVAKFGLETIRRNDELISPILDDSFDFFTDLVDNSCSNLPNIVSNPVRTKLFVEAFESRIKALDLRYKERDQIKAENLTDDEVQEIQEAIAQRVADGETFEEAVKSIVGEDKAFSLEIDSPGDCIRYEDRITNEPGVTELRSYSDGAILETKQKTQNGFTARTRKIVEGGEVKTYISCLVCGNEFDICAEACQNPRCQTPRNIQYNAWKHGKSLRELERYKKRYYENETKVDENVFFDTDEESGGWFNNAFEGMLSGLLEALTFGIAKPADAEEI